MIEAVIALAVLAVISALAVPTYHGVRKGLDENKNTIVLAGYVAKARNIAAQVGNAYQYPGDTVAQLVSLDDKVTEGPSTSGELISVARIDADGVIFAVAAENGYCYTIVDSIETDVQRYAYDPSAAACEAGMVDHLLVTGTQEDPNEVDIS